MKIGLISDTHFYLDPAVLEHFKDCDEIWHAGDFGTIEVADALREIAPLRGVYGNIDGQDIRQEFPLRMRFQVNGLDVFMTHIGGTLGRYAIPCKDELLANPPDVFICGHSHILKIARDMNTPNRMLYLNPGAAGRHGFQEFRTIVRFEVDNGKMHNMDVITLGSRAE
jgi:putative phosphoesterase